VRRLGKGVVVPFYVGLVDVELLVDVDVVVMVDVDVDIPPSPVAATPQGVVDAADRNAPNEAGDERSTGIVVGRRRSVIRRVGRPPPRAVDCGRLVHRHIDLRGLRRLDHDHALAAFGLHADLLLVAGFEVAGFLCLLAQ